MKRWKTVLGHDRNSLLLSKYLSIFYQTALYQQYVPGHPEEEGGLGLTKGDHKWALQCIGLSKAHFASEVNSQIDIRKLSSNMAQREVADQDMLLLGIRKGVDPERFGCPQNLQTKTITTTYFCTRLTLSWLSITPLGLPVVPDCGHEKPYLVNGQDKTKISHIKDECINKFLTV